MSSAKHVRRFFLKMSFYDNEGNTFGTRAIEISSAHCGHRPSFIDLHPPTPGFGITVFDDAVKILEVRELRRKEFVADAVRMGEALADYLEDKEGWHGTRRQERIVQVEKDKK